MDQTQLRVLYGQVEVFDGCRTASPQSLQLVVSLSTAAVAPASLTAAVCCNKRVSRFRPQSQESVEKGDDILAVMGWYEYVGGICTGRWATGMRCTRCALHPSSKEKVACKVHLMVLRGLATFSRTCEERSLCCVLQPLHAYASVCCAHNTSVSDEMAEVSNSRCFVEITDQRLDLVKYIQLVTDPEAGAISSFVGTTRNNFQGKAVLRLEYEAYVPMALDKMKVLGCRLCAGPLIVSAAAPRG